jgi:hypothetical protein
MKVRRLPVWGQAGVLVLVAALVATLVVAVTRRSDLPALPGKPLQVGLGAPGSAMVGGSIPVKVSAIGPDPVARIELWAGSDLVAAEDPDGGRTAVLLDLDWLPQVAGGTTLVARALDSGGRVGVSNSVHVAVWPGLDVQVVDDDLAGSTLSELAGEGSELARALNTGIDPDAPLEHGAIVRLPSTRLAGDARSIEPSGAQQLSLTAAPEGCDVSLTVAGLSDPAARPEGWSLEIHRHLAQGTGTVRVATITTGGTELTLSDNPAAGTHVYSAVEHSATTAVSPLVAVDVTDCPLSQTVSIGDGVLHVDEPVDGVFAYLSWDGGTHRVPADPAELIVGDGVNFDLGPYLPTMPDTDIGVEIWGRVGAAVTLLGSQVIAAGSLQAPGTSLDAMWDVFGLSGPLPVRKLTAYSNETVEFEWSTPVSHVGVRWFLARTKPDQASSLSPAGVVQTELASAHGGNARFAIDLNKNAAASVAPLSFEMLSAESTFVEMPVAQGGPGVATRALPSSPGTNWVWAVPVDTNGNPVGPASNLVELVIKPAPYDPTVAPPYDVVDIKVTIPPAPNPALRGCVRIVSEQPAFPLFVGSVYSDGSAAPIGGMKITGTLPYTYKNGVAVYPFTACPGETETYCSGSCGEGDLLTALGQAIASGVVDAFEFVADAVNWVAETYNYVKAYVIGKVADVLCPSAVKSTCQTLIEVAVDALLTSVGIPPTLPSFDDLANAAKGELVDLALDQLGIGEACDAISGAATGKTCGEVAAALAEQDACALAPKGQEQQCRVYVETAADLCGSLTDQAQCELATKNARDLVETGMGKAYDLAVELTQQQVTASMYEALTGVPYDLYASESGCAWGGTDGTKVVCPPFVKVPEGCFEQTDSFGPVPPGVICPKPPPERVAIPEPRGHHQPIRVDVKIERNGNPLPANFQCPPISAEATTITPSGAIGQPYLAATTTKDITYDPLFESGWVQQQQFTLWLREPNPFVTLAPENLPPEQQAAAQLSEKLFGIGPSAGGWESLLVPGSLVGIRVFGDCIGEAFPDTGPWGGIVGAIPPPLPRITPGES